MEVAPDNNHKFLSTPSARRATYNVYDGTTKQLISIHALREEGDRRRQTRRGLVSYFYPRPPRGGRRIDKMRKARQRHFYPRPPRGGRRSSGESILPLEEISIHALREEGDGTQVIGTCLGMIFLSTPSARRATYHRRSAAPVRQISIHALREEGDLPSMGRVIR